MIRYSLFIIHFFRKKSSPPLERFSGCAILLPILSEVVHQGLSLTRSKTIWISDILKDYNFLREREDEHKTLHFGTFMI